MSGFLRRAFDTRQRIQTDVALEEILAREGRLQRSHTGRYVTPDIAMTVATVYRCVRVIADSVAQLPLMLYRRNSQGEREQATDHPLWHILHTKPNRLMTPFTWKQTNFNHLLLRGNAYNEIDWSKDGYPESLWPLRPDGMKAELHNRQPIYEYSPSQTDMGQEGRIPDWRVHHIKGLSNDGFVGESPVRQAMHALELALATEEFGGRFFDGDATPTLALTHPMSLSTEAHQRIKDSWKQSHRGLDRSHEVAILEEGMEPHAIGIAPEEAQFLETRRFQTIEICRWFSVPPHMVYDLERATFSNIEHQAIAFVNDSLLPWLIAHEQQIAMDLIERDSYESTLWAEYLVEGRLRGDTVSRYRAYQIAVMYGLKTRNEVRKLENDPPYDGGDDMLVPANLAKADQLSAMDQGSDENAPDPDDGETRTGGPGAIRADDADSVQVLRDLWAEKVDGLAAAVGRILRKELAAVRKELAARSIEDFLLWLDGYHEELAGMLRDAIASRMRTLAVSTGRTAAADLEEDWTAALRTELEEFGDDLAEGEAAGYAANHRRQLEAVIRRDAEAGDEAILVGVEERLLSWEQTEAEKRGRELAFKGGNAILLAAFVAFGIRYTSWDARGDACPYCRGLDGKVVEIGSDFVSAGGQVAGADGMEALQVSGRRTHPPLHGGCDCGTRARREG